MEHLQSNTTYNYVVTSVDTTGNESIRSNTLTITTKELGSSYEQWNAYKAYTKGDKVEHKDKIYEADNTPLSGILSILIKGYYY